MSELTWKPQNKPWSSGEAAYLGKWKVGAVDYDPTTSMDDENKYVVECRLPGIKDFLGRFKDLHTAKSTLALVVQHWIAEAGLK